MEIWQLSLMVFSMLLVVGFLIRYWDSLVKIVKPKIIKKVAEKKSQLKERLHENRGNGLEVKSMRETYEEYKDEE